MREYLYTMKRALLVIIAYQMEILGQKGSQETSITPWNNYCKNVQTVLFIDFLKHTKCFPPGHSLTFKISNSWVL